MALLAGLVGTGCDPSPTDLDLEPRSGLRLEAGGRPERGLLLRLTLTDTATAVPDTEGLAPSWSAEPADAVTFVPLDDTEGDSIGSHGTIGVRLLREGPIRIIATVGERRARLDLEIAAPPIVVFEMTRDGGRDIYRAALDGADLVRLSSGQHDNRTPTVANGRVVFVSYRDGNGELYSVPLAGGVETRLTRTGTHETEPALAPDGRRLAFISTASGVPKLWVAAGDATGAMRAAPEFGFGGSLEAAPSWAPDGERLVFVSTTAGTADLYSYILASRLVEPLFVTPAPEVEPAWSPDGEWIAFASTREGQTDLYRLRIATGEVERLTDRAETDARPAWLRDGRLVYIAWVDGVPRLRWLDPAVPGEVHEVPLGAGTVGRVSAVW